MKKSRKFFPSRAAMLLLMTMLTSVGAWAAVPATTPQSWLAAGGTGGSGTDSDPYYVNMPANGTATTFETAATLNVPIDVTLFKLYDNGGKNDSYSWNYTGYLVITTSADYVFQLSGSIYTYKNRDKLTVWDSNGTSGTKLLDGVSGASYYHWTDLPTVTSTGNVMTVYFNSSNPSAYEGFDITVKVAKLTDLQLATITGVESSYGRTSSAVSINPTVKAADGTTLTLGTHFTATLNGNNVSSFPFEVNDAGDYTLTVNGKGDYIGSQSVSFHVTTLGGITYDSEGDYFKMTKAQDFEDLAAFVDAGYNCNGMTFKMTGPVQFGDGTGTGDANHTPIGSEAHRFAGTFDGQNNTISGLIVNATDYAGLFGYTDSYCKIQNVTITNSRISATGNYAGGFVGYAHGTNTEITNCHVTASVTVSATGDNAGGILGRSNIQQSAGIIKNNSSAATVSGNQYVGGITGFGPAVIAKIEDCIYTGSSVTGTNNVGAITGGVSSSSDGLVNCYTTNAMTSIGSGENGMFLYSSAPATGLYYPITIMDYTGYANCTVSNLHDGYLTDGTNPTDIVPVVKDATGNEFTAGTDYTISYSPNASPIAAGNYTMTITGVSANCSGSYTHDFTLVAQSFEGSGTQESPYLIATTDQLAQVAQYVNDGSLGSGSSVKYYKLTADLDYTGKTYAQIGTDANRFNGVFDGQGHTIKGITVEAVQPGLFGYIENATVKNLWLDNSSFTVTETSNSSIFVGCFVCRSYNSTIENCHVSSQVTISKINYSAWAGGIVGLSKRGTIKGCTSDVHLDETKTVNKCGGIVARDDDGDTGIYDNLYYGTYFTNESGIFFDAPLYEGGKMERYWRNLTAASCEINGSWIHKATVVSCSDELTGTFDIVHNGTNEDIRENTYPYNGLKVVYNNNDFYGRNAKGIYFNGILYIHTSYKYTANLSPKRTGFTSTKYYRNGSAFSDSNGENGAFNSEALISWDYDYHYWDVVYGLTLADNATTNADIIDTFDGAVSDVTLSGRTLYKDGAWNTLCLPFAVTAEQIAAYNDFKNCTIMELDADGDHDGKKTGLADDGMLYLYFKTATSIEAGKPYLIKWNSGSNIVEPTFSGVTISNASTTVTASNSGLKTVEFRGIYDPVTLPKDDKSNLYLGSANKLYWPSADVKLNAFRAYFHVDGGSVSAVKMNFDEGETTGIIEMEDVRSQKADVNAVFDLQGRRVAQPTKGLYIVNGKKIVIK